MRRFSGTAAAATLGAALLASALPAQAAVLVTIQEVGPDVLISGSGTVNTAALIQDSYTGWFGPNIFPAGAQILLGTLPPAEFDTIRYRGITGPASFGPVSAYFIASSGDVFGVSGGSGFLHLPLYGPGFTNPYVSGTQLSATATVNNATLQDMGLVAGTYTWTWGTGVNADSFTVQIGAAPPPPAHPGPRPLRARSLRGRDRHAGRRPPPPHRRLIPGSRSPDLRAPEAAEAANAARRTCGEPSRRMAAPALEDEMRQHFMSPV